MKRAFFFTVFNICAMAALAEQPSATTATPPKKYEPTWESINSRPTPKWYTDAKFGIFIHFGVYSVPSWSVRGEYSEWYWNHIADKNKKNNPWWDFHVKNYGKDFDYSSFAPMFRAELFDADFWAKTIAGSGAKYVALTSKHHDGFCLWPSEEANRTWGRPWNSVAVGPKRDLLGELTAAGRKHGLKMGIYYSLYEWFNPLWLRDKDRYVTEHMHPQFKDVVTRYAPSIIFSDGEWDLPAEKWRSAELLAWLFNESPCRADVVINDRWGKDDRHKKGGYWTTEYGAGMPNADHPWEENRGMGNSYGYSRTEPLEDYRKPRELIWMLADLVSRGGNLLLDIGPTGDGRIPVIMQDRLAEMGRWLKVNGEAIYATTSWKQPCQWSEGKQPRQGYKDYKEQYDIAKLAGMKPVGGQARKQAFFTAKPGVLYAILPIWPEKQFTLKGVRPGKDTTVQLLGLDGKLSYHESDGNTVIDMPPLGVDQLPCSHAWTLKISELGDGK